MDLLYNTSGDEREAWGGVGQRTCCTTRQGMKGKRGVGQWIVYNTSGDEREAWGAVGAQCARVDISRVGTGMW